MRFFSLAAIAAALSLSGCAYFTTYKSDLGTPQTGVSVDIKQRMLLINKKTDGAGNTTGQRFCAEPSPDALASLGASLGASNVTGGGNTTQISAALSESAAFVGLRTQSIQLMRDAMYRACEAYMSEAINSDDYLFLQRRFQAQVVGLLAIEQLTGAIAAQPVTVHNNAAASAGGGANAEADRLADARKKLAEQQVKVDESNAAVVEAQTKYDGLDTKVAPLSGKKDSELTEAERTTRTEFESSTKALKAAKSDAALQTNLIPIYKEAVSVAEEDFKAAKGRTSASASGFSSTPIAISARPVSDAAVEKVADSVTKIVSTVFSGAFNDEAGRCLRKLYLAKESEWDRIAKICSALSEQDYQNSVAEALAAANQKPGAKVSTEKDVQGDPKVQSTKAVRDAVKQITPQ